MTIEVLPILSLSLIDFRDMTTFVLSDTSSYEVVPVSGQFALQVTAPGYSTVNISTFTPGQVNVFTCADLGITCSDSGCTPLPDGIYNIVYSVNGPGGALAANPAVLTLQVIKIDQIKCQYQHAFLKADLNCGTTRGKNQYTDELRKIKLFIDGSVAECANSNYILSQDLYQKADYMLSKLPSGKCTVKNYSSGNGYSYGSHSGCGCK